MSPQAHRDDEQTSVDTADSPGRRLRIARQARGMSQADIAAQLHLSSTIINALETDEHERMPGPVFVRGYLRNYARLLGLDENDVLSEYGGNTQARTPNATPSLSSGVQKEIRSSHIGVRLITWLIVIGLIALVVAWWQGRIEWPDMGVIDPGMETTTPETDRVNDDGRLSLPELRSQPETEPGMETPRPDPRSPAPASENIPEADITRQGTTAGPDVTTGTYQTETTPAISEPSPATEVNLDIEESAPVARNQTDAAPSPTPGQTTAQASQSPPVAGQVVFEFIGACWVDVRDSTRKFKLFGEMRKGEKKVLGGTPPYSVILGNSPMVRVSVNGVPFDVEAHSHGNVARFTLALNETD